MNTKLRKTGAAVILAVMVPLIVDAATEPAARRSVPESWCYGAAKAGAACALAWAIEEVGRP